MSKIDSEAFYELSDLNREQLGIVSPEESQEKFSLVNKSGLLKTKIYDLLKNDFSPNETVKSSMIGSSSEELEASAMSEKQYVLSEIEKNKIQASIQQGKILEKQDPTQPIIPVSEFEKKVTESFEKNVNSTHHLITDEKNQIEYDSHFRNLDLEKEIGKEERGKIEVKRATNVLKSFFFSDFPKIKDIHSDDYQFMMSCLLKDDGLQDIMTKQDSKANEMLSTGSDQTWQLKFCDTPLPENKYITQLMKEKNITNGFSVIKQEDGSVDITLSRFSPAQIVLDSSFTVDVFKQVKCEDMYIHVERKIQITKDGEFKITKNSSDIYTTPNID